MLKNSLILIALDVLDEKRFDLSFNAHNLVQYSGDYKVAASDLCLVLATTTSMFNFNLMGAQFPRYVQMGLSTFQFASLLPL